MTLFRAACFTATGYDPIPMVPCSELSAIIDLNHLPGAIFCSREEEAIALGAGLFLGGKSPLVMMQSSGLMSSMNTIGSLLVAYSLPITLLIAMRGGSTERNPTQIPAARAVRTALLNMECQLIEAIPQQVIETLSTIGPKNAKNHETAQTPKIVLMGGSQ